MGWENRNVVGRSFQQSGRNKQTSFANAVKPNQYQKQKKNRGAAGTAGTYPANVQTGLAKASFIDLVLEERRIELTF